MAVTNSYFNIANQSATADERSNDEATPINYATFFILLPTILVGLVTNILIVIVMRRLKISKTARFFYVTIAIFDCGILLSYYLCHELLKRGLSAVSGGLIVVTVDGSFFGCKLMYLATFATESWSNLMAALLAFDRFMRVCHPFAKLTYRRMRILCLVAILLSLAVNTSALRVFVFEGKEGEEKCSITSDREAHWLLLFLQIDAIVLPGFAMIIFNWLIVVKLRRRRQSNLPASKTVADASKFRKEAGCKSAQKLIARSRQSKSQSESVAVLLYMSIIFVAIFTPVVVTHAFCVANSMFCQANQLMYQVAALVHSTNFFVYFWCMKKFRRQFSSVVYSIVRICSCGLFRKRTSATQSEIELESSKPSEQRLASTSLENV